MKIMIMQGSFSVITELVCATFPAFLFRELKISRRSKVVLCILMDLGVITAVVCIVRTSFSYQVLSEEVFWVGLANAIARIVKIHTGRQCSDPETVLALHPRPLDGRRSESTYFPSCSAAFPQSLVLTFLDHV